MPRDRDEETTEKRTTRPAGRTVRAPPRPTLPRNRRLEERTVAELRERAKQLDIPGRSKMNKDELVRAIRRKNG